jgi:hypothetical protein
MATSGVYKWNVYCVNESKLCTAYLSNVPTVCPNNNTHVIDMKQTVMVPGTTTVQSVYIQIEEDIKKTQGRYQARTIRADIVGSYDLATVGGITPVDFVLPFPITLMAVQFQCQDLNIGDEVTCIIDPNKSITTLTAESKSGTNTLTIDPSVCLAMETTINETVTSRLIGLGASIYDTDTKTRTNLDLIRSVNSTTGVITLDKNITSNIAAGKILQVNRYMVRDFYINNGGTHSLGYSKLGGSYIPTDTIGTIYYKNNGYSTKTFTLTIEFYY